jgi:DNA-binding response OmpR family regulator
MPRGHGGSTPTEEERDEATPPDLDAAGATRARGRGRRDAEVTVPRTTALLVEDDARFGALVTEYLARHEVDVTVALDGERGLAALGRGRFDVALLDVMLPGLDGFEVCRRIRADPSLVGIPVIMLTARGDDVDKIVGLELGADDYLAKPFNPRELLARIRAVLRRARPGAGPRPARLLIGDIEIDFDAREVTVRGRRQVLTHYEFELLAALARAAGRVLSRERLLDLLKGQDYEAFDRSIDVHVSKLRAKLEDDPKEPRYIKTVRGVGYVLIRESG